MFFLDIVVALAVSVLLTAVFSLLFGNQGPWASFWIFLLVIFLASWAGGLWVAPFGPVLWGVSWMPFVLSGLLFALLLAAAVTTTEPTDPQVTVPVRAEEAALAAYGTFFWVLMTVFVVVILIAYL